MQKTTLVSNQTQCRWPHQGHYVVIQHWVQHRNSVCNIHHNQQLQFAASSACSWIFSDWRWIKRGAAGLFAADWIRRPHWDGCMLATRGCCLCCILYDSQQLLLAGTCAYRHPLHKVVFNPNKIIFCTVLNPFHIQFLLLVRQTNCIRAIAVLS